MIGFSWLLLLIAVLGPAGLLLAVAVSPMAPLIRYWMFGLFALAVAVAIAVHLGDGVIH